jgi:hypothetical protein
MKLYSVEVRYRNKRAIGRWSGSVEAASVDAASTEGAKKCKRARTVTRIDSVSVTFVRELAPEQPKPAALDELRARIADLIDCAALWAGGDDSPVKWTGLDARAVALMKAAPDLLGALEQAVPLFDSPDYDSPENVSQAALAVRAMRAAIAKAKGEA